MTTPPTRPRTAPYGAWESPIDPALVASAGISFPRAWALPGGATAWLEGRPTEAGRVALVRRDPQRGLAELTPPEANVRTRVHEYGGGASWFYGDTVFYTHFADQRLYRLDPGREPRAITPEPPEPSADRYADGDVASDGRFTICVRERHEGREEPANEIVVIPTDGSADPHVIVMGSDFYSTPRISPDGRRLAWLSWDHPQMPWDGTELWVAELDPHGSVTHATRVAGGTTESIFQPAWSPEGVLHFVSDRTGWWNLYAYRDGIVAPLAPMQAECGVPQWSFDASTYGFARDGRILCAVRSHGLARLVLIERDGRVRPIETPYTAIGSVTVEGDRAAFVGASPTEAPSVVALDLATGSTEVLRRSLDVELDEGYLSVPEAIEFPSGGGATAHAIYYPPRNRDFVAPEAERPPLLVLSHGGPTGATDAALSLRTQFWISRGFAVVDVNYRGSTGYGRAYRDALKGQWGIADVEDCVAAARHLAERGDVDGSRMAIRGGSAGGYTTLCALTFHDAFAAGASHYGIGDLEVLIGDTHKFESRYTDQLIGPYPEAREVYVERSPVHHLDRLSCPVILFQGLEDRIVPPSQAEAIVAALKAKRIPHAYLAFEGEQHGFRKAENIVRTLEAELSFYGQIMGFEPAGTIEPVEISRA